MDIRKSKETCKAYINAIDTFGTIDYKCINNLYEPIKTVLSELEKKDRIIKEMAKTINKEYYKDIIENYTKKVEKEGIKE